MSTQQCTSCSSTACTSATCTNENVKKCNEILEYLYDSRDGYQKSSEDVKDVTLKQLYLTIAQRRNQMVTDLHLLIKQSGVQPIESGSMTAAAHRTWIDFKTLVTGSDRQAVIAEIKRGESYLIEKYESFLKSTSLPETFQQLLKRQLKEIEEQVASVDQMK
ncbi:unnamed protein product [Didymodactylos carnosus]|uniref:DUF2383 domain-containing protein n=1 Tax=Didymodactylos carnosus TaxID=1234261 RepID=A0A814TKV5_9BILA|nr:unnamed protein product [Didymodactylos carnosus]CAF1161133.1 unnamed protein product [Didymodactylos carnosus]CAF3766429.1 unnamed protein product [Didymodactylos carnosus]CAF3924718.1 unnamed protein product [Didymodactylos carnosus]